MSTTPRVAIGSVQPEADHQCCSWALMAALVGQGLQVQPFQSQACFTAIDASRAITGRGSRYLDSWLMSRDVVGELFAYGAKNADFSVVSGRFDTARTDGASSPGGSLDQLCLWLALPRLAVIDVSRLGECELPPRPCPADGLVLDRVPATTNVYAIQTRLESLWGLPVVGAVDALPRLRAAIEATPPGAAPPAEACRELGTRFLEHADIRRIRRIAASRELPAAPSRLFGAPADSTRINIAMAFDDAFCCYFADALDLLECQGASITTFSPLRDEVPPDDADLIYLGCGHPERYADQLAENHCMLFGLRDLLHRGRRIYAEGGGLAYLCQFLEAPDGRRVPMAGLLPATARPNPQRPSSAAVEVKLATDTWIATSGTRLRGYLNPNWLIEPTDALTGCVEEATHRYDVVTYQGAVGSRIHLNFAARLDVLRGIFEPYPAARLTTAAARSQEGLRPR